MKTPQGKAKIISNCRVSRNYYKIILLASQDVRQAVPGQFVMFKVNAATEPLLRRPLSIHRIKGAQIEFLYEVIGEGTAILAQKNPGEYLDIIGPLGEGFDLKPETGNRKPILVAGGMGVAPLVFLAEKLRHIKPMVLIGARTKEQILCAKEFRALGCRVRVATDDGSKGYKGYVSELLNILLSTVDRGPWTIYACGPQPMLKMIAVITRERNISAQVSLEAHMSCGFGACLGCAVSTIDGYKRVCKEGPVFNAEEIRW